MARPTREQVDHGHYLLEQLASRYESRNNPNGWPDIYKLLDLHDWLDVDYDRAKRTAVFGPGGARSPEGGGTIGANTIGRHGLTRPTEARFTYLDAMTNQHRGIVLNDPLVKALAELRAEWASQLAIVDRMQQRADKVAGWPRHVPETG